MAYKYSLPFLFITFFSLSSWAQNLEISSAKQDPAVLKYMKTITAEDLHAHLSFLASDELEGRETAYRGQKIAAQYLAAQFHRLGLQAVVNSSKGKSWFQPFTLIRSQVDEVNISLGSKKQYTFGKDFISFSMANLATPISGDLVFVGYGIQEEQYDNYSGMLVDGKVVVALSGEPLNEDGSSKITKDVSLSSWTSDWRKKRDFAQQRGAVGFLMIISQTQFDDLSGSSYVQHIKGSPSLRLKNEEDESIPMIILSENMGNELMKKSKITVQEAKDQQNEYAIPVPLNLKKMSFQLLPKAISEEVISENVLGFLEGTDKKDEILVLTAHYDHLGAHDGEIFNGADDDGSGVSTIIELAEAFSLAAEEGNRPRRSILFMPVAGEEKGLLGSQFYSEYPVFPLENTVANLNVDMIGRVDPEHEEKNEENYVYIIGSDRLSSDLHEVNETANTTYTRLELDYTFNAPDDPNRFYYRSDHYNFAKNGVPVIFYFTGVHEDYHKSTDTIDKIMFPKMSTIAQLIFTSAWEIANREERLLVDKKED